MKDLVPLTRRQFISSVAVATAAVVLPGLGQSTLGPDWEDAGIIATRKSPYAKLKSLPVRAVRIQPGFWSKRLQTNVESSIPTMRAELIEHGRMDNFLRLERQATGSQQGPVYSDSDIYKWVEAVGFTLQSGPQPALRAKTEEMIRRWSRPRSRAGT